MTRSRAWIGLAVAVPVALSVAPIALWWATAADRAVQASADRLRAAGWSDFHDLTLDGEIAIVAARRPSGRLFELEVHRCSGEVVNARPQRSQAHDRRRYPSRS